MMIRWRSSFNATPSIVNIPLTKCLPMIKHPPMTKHFPNTYQILTTPNPHKTSLLVPMNEMPSQRPYSNHTLCNERESPNNLGISPFWQSNFHIFLSLMNFYEPFLDKCHQHDQASPHQIRRNNFQCVFIDIDSRLVHAINGMFTICLLVSNYGTVMKYW